jgi:hypothetical protein
MEQTDNFAARLQQLCGDSTQQRVPDHSRPAGHINHTYWMCMLVGVFDAPWCHHRCRIVNATCAPRPGLGNIKQNRLRAQHTKGEASKLQSWGPRDVATAGGFRGTSSHALLAAACESQAKPLSCAGALRLCGVVDSRCMVCSASSFPLCVTGTHQTFSTVRCDGPTMCLLRRPV